jgi:glycerol-3-phosphate dehydrogenase
VSAPPERVQPAERVQAVIIGGGVVGCALLRELAERRVEAVLVEAEDEVGGWASRGNSGIVHSGFDATPGSPEAALLRRAAGLWPALVETLRVPFRRVGALMVARNETERARISNGLSRNAATLGVGVELLDRAALRREAPYVTDSALAGLSIPDEALVDPWPLTRAYAGAAVAAGARVILGRRVVGLDVGRDRVRVVLDDGAVYQADQAFDSAGLQADDVARLAGDDGFRIRPRKGQFLVVSETAGVDRIVLPVPGPMGKGTLVTPIISGGLLLGPTAEDLDDKGDRSVDPTARGRIMEACAAMVPAVAGFHPTHQFAGLRTVSSTGGSVIRPSTAGDRLWLLAGIRSTGVSVSPALAEAVAEQVAPLRGWARRRTPVAPA